MILLSMLLKTSVVLALAALVDRTAARRASAAVRHLVWTVAVLALLLLPIAAAVVPSWPIATFVDVGGMAQPAPARPSADAGHEVTWRRDGVAPNGAAAHPDRDASPTFAAPSTFVSTIVPLLPAGYAVVVLLMLARLALQHRSLRRRTRRAHAVGDDAWRALLRECAAVLDVTRTPHLVRSLDHAMPMTFGTMTPVIVIPAVADTWTDDRRRAVLLHELAHSVRRDCFTQALASVCCALYWMHPGVWWAARRLRVERELACDDLVIAAGASGCDYADHLLELAYSLTPAGAVPAVTMADVRDLERRLRAALDAARNRARTAMKVRVGAVAVMTLVLVPLAAATAGTGRGDGADRPAPAARRHVDHAQSFTRLSEYASPSAARVFATVKSAFERAVAWANSNLALLDELNVQQYETPSPADLVRLSQHGVDRTYVREMARLGYRLGTIDALIEQRRHGVSASYIRDLADAGLTGLSSEDLLRARAHGVDGEFIWTLGELGYANLSLDRLIDLRSYGVDGEYAFELRTLGYEWSLDELVEARRHGIDPAFVYAFQQLGYGGATLHDFIDLRSHGVAPAQARRANAGAGYDLSVDDLVRLAAHGWKR